ncbi:MAG TPA: IS3 family transposase, partial [Flavisolibacter sp.]|nr:IS3 family transposase [Flavisolibacter sp.]
MNVGQRRSRSISTLCSLLGYSRQAFYQQAQASETQVLEEDLIVQEVLRIRKPQKAVGTRKLLPMLQPFLELHNIQIGRDALFDLLASHRLLIRKRKRKVPKTTFSGHWYRKYPNLIVGMPVLKANKLWVSDITYITLKDEFAYLSLVTDAYSRKIAGYYLSKRLQAEGCVKALKMALKQADSTDGLIHHSDRGTQYCSTEYVEQLQARGIAISMTQNSEPSENAIAERVNGIIKQEFLENSYATFAQANQAIKDAVDIYNNERLHSSVDMLTPAQAHLRTGELKRRWKNYYKKKKEVTM